jgi:hypothetical protein
MHAACVNPSALAGGEGAPTPYFWSGGWAQGAAAPAPWATGKTVTTPFASTPGLLTTDCVRQGEFSYLKVTTHGDPADPRVDQIVGDVMIMGQPDPNWGLHLIDMNHSMGDLVAMVEAQAAAWTHHGHAGP